MKIKINILVLSGFLMGIGPLFAQDTLKFSMTDAIQYALENSYTIKSADLDVQSAQKKVFETIAIGLPQLNASAVYNHTAEAPVMVMPDFFGGNPNEFIEVSFSQPYDANVGVSVSQLIFDGSYLVGLKASRVFLDLYKNAKEKTTIEIKQGVSELYLLALSAKDNITTFKANLKLNEQMLYETQKMYQAGLVEETDVDQVNLMFRNSRTGFLEMERGYNIALSVLKYLMGIENAHSIILTDQFSDLISSIKTFEQNASFYDLDVHIDYKIANTNVVSEKLLLQNQKAKALPSLSAFYNLQYGVYSDQSNVFNKDWNRSQILGLKINIPILSSGMRQSQYNQRKIALKKAENERESVKHNLQSNLLQAFTNFESKKEIFENNLEALKLSKKIYEKSIIKYKNGMISSMDLVQVETQFNLSQTSYVGSSSDMINAHLLLQKAIGKL